MLKSAIQSNYQHYARLTDHKNHDSFTLHHRMFETAALCRLAQAVCCARRVTKKFDANFIPFYLYKSSAQRHQQRTESFCARYCTNNRVRKTDPAQKTDGSEKERHRKGKSFK